MKTTTAVYATLTAAATLTGFVVMGHAAFSGGFGGLFVVYGSGVALLAAAAYPGISGKIPPEAKSGPKARTVKVAAADVKTVITPAK